MDNDSEQSDDNGTKAAPIRMIEDCKMEIIPERSEVSGDDQDSKFYGNNKDDGHHPPLAVE